MAENCTGESGDSNIRQQSCEPENQNTELKDAQVLGNNSLWVCHFLATTFMSHNLSHCQCKMINMRSFKLKILTSNQA